MDWNMSALLLYQLFWYLWAVPQQKVVYTTLILAKQKVEGVELIRLWAVKLRGASCNTNLILSSQGLSTGGVDPLIDDWTPHFCLSKHARTLWSSEMWLVIDQCKTCLQRQKKKQLELLVLLSAVRSSQDANTMQRLDTRPGTDIQHHLVHTR